MTQVKQTKPLVGFRKVFKEKDLKQRDKYKAYISNEEAYALAKALAAFKEGANGVVLDMRFETKDPTNPSSLSGFAIISEGGTGRQATNFQKKPVQDNVAVAAAMSTMRQDKTIVDEEL